MLINHPCHFDLNFSLFRSSSEPTAMSEPSSSIMKRPRASSRDSTTNLQHDDYTVAWISALPLEMTAAEAMLDAIRTPLSRHPQDSNCYTLGSINGHNVVMACLPKGHYGTNNAATVARHLTRSFLNNEISLNGIPSDREFQIESRSCIQIFTGSKILMSD